MSGSKVRKEFSYDLECSAFVTRLRLDAIDEYISQAAFRNDETVNDNDPFTTLCSNTTQNAAAVTL
jgi:hypothetical protein